MVALVASRKGEMAILNKADGAWRGAAASAASQMEAAAAARQRLDARIGRIVGRADEESSGQGFQRREKRRPDKRVGVILLPDGGRIDCMIEDLSANGFRIELAAPAAAPLRFSLLVPTLRQRFQVARRWVGETAIGVEIRRRMDLRAAPRAD